MQIFNDAINPKEEPDTYPVMLMHSRASEIKTAKPLNSNGTVAGRCNPETGLVCVPTGDNAYDRTIRFHEAMHAAHSLPHVRLKDLLDQSLEDARIHRYCSKSAISEHRQARNDELEAARIDLTAANEQPKLTAQACTTIFRAYAIIDAGDRSIHAHLLHTLLSRLGKSAATDFRNALDCLKASNGNPKQECWKEARKHLEKYFTTKFESDKESEPDKEGEPSDTIPADTEEESDEEPKEAKEAKVTDVPMAPAVKRVKIAPKKESEPDKEGEPGKEGESGESESDKAPSKPSEPSPESKDTSESASDSTSDTGEPSDTIPADTEEESDEEPKEAKEAKVTDVPMAPAVKRVKIAPKKESEPDEYTASLMPECDKKTYLEMNDKFPLKLMIRRLDMGINRVKLAMGRRTPTPVMSGRKILARKLAGAYTTPGVRVFSNPVAQGGFGSILIDASSSMCIPESALIEFLDKAPALTIAFYNAPGDTYKTTKHGNLYIYAANGYRASLPHINGTCIAEYSYGNLIDYQAMAWLIKQPAPRYLITDWGFTGPWNGASRELLHKLLASKQIERQVRTLEQMQAIITAQTRKR